MATVFDAMTVKCWHGGYFRSGTNGELEYVGGKGKTSVLDPDEMCFFDLVDVAKKCGGYEKLQTLCYLVPGLSLVNGLRKITNDKDVLEMAKLAKQYRCIDVYVVHAVQDEPELQPTAPSPTKKHFQPISSSTRGRKKLTPKKPTKIQKSKYAATSCSQSQNIEASPKDAFLSQIINPTPPIQPLPVLRKPQRKSVQINPKKSLHLEKGLKVGGGSDLEDSDLQISHGIDDIVTDFSSDSVSDPIYKPDVREDESESEHEEYFDDLIWEELEELQDYEYEKLQEDDNVEETDDEEYQEARNRVRETTSRLIEISRELQREAAAGKLRVEKCVPTEGATGGAEESEGATRGAEEYENSSEEVNTPPGSDDESGGVVRKRWLLVSPNTDFKVFKWEIGQRFATRQDFKNAVCKYAVMQGRRLRFSVSNKNKQQQLGVKCAEGCPFELFGSWHSKLATFLVRKVVGSHTCHRDMKRNPQLTSSWAARELVEVFKARPHWPTKEIADTVRKAYNVIVTVPFAYKIKYHAHRLLHGSIKDHYNKVGRYIEALKLTSPGSVVDLVVDRSKATSAPIFQRLFICFEGLKKRWKEGCRRVICVDASFLKTFLGGQVLCAVGIDSNDEMYPIAWAVVEGENNSSYE